MNLDSTALIAKHLSGNAMPEDEQQLIEWRKQDPFNDELFLQVEKLWQVSGTLSDDIDPDIEKAWERFKYSTNLPEQVKRSPTWKRWLRIASAVAALVAASLFITSISKNQQKQAPSEELSAEFKTPEMITVQTTDSVSTFFLPDSTKIILNKNSSFSYPKQFDGVERTTFLKGEAFLEVRQDRLHPFVVNSMGTRTEVHGTSFAIKAYEKDEDVELNVISGEVKFISTGTPNNNIVLHKGEMVTLDKKNAVLSKGISNTHNSWWRNNLKKKVRDFFKDVKQKMN